MPVWAAAAQRRGVSVSRSPIFVETYLPRSMATGPRVALSGWVSLPWAILAVTGQVAVALPPAPEWQGQEAFATVFGFVPRFAVASLVAYWAGEFTNSYTLAKLKLFTGGRWLWTRTVGSTVIGQAVDTAVVVADCLLRAPSPPLMILRMVAFVVSSLRWRSKSLPLRSRILL